MIPNNIFQTHKSLNYIFSNPILKEAHKSWQIKDYNYFFYNDNQCDNFINEHFPEIKDAYDSLPLRVMKADLWRYCIIYKSGGIYADSDTELLIHPSFFRNNNNIHFIVTPENDIHFCQWCFAAVANSPVLKKVIDLSVERIRNTNVMSGEHLIHYLTGPGVFTDGIFNYLNISLNAYGNNFEQIANKITTYEAPYNKINIGSSNNNSKTVKFDKNIKSDQNISILSKQTFSYLTNENKLTIKRTDIDSNWKQYLVLYQFNCIKNIMIIPSTIFHKDCILHKFSGQWNNGWLKEWNEWCKKSKIKDIINSLKNQPNTTSKSSNTNDKFQNLINTLKK